MDKIKSEKKQHIKEWSRRTILFVFSPFVLGMWVALTIRANLGSSPITCPPYVLSRYDNSSLSVGEYIFCMQFSFVIVQWALLGKDFKKIQFLQLAVCLTFGLFSDFGMWATKSLIWQSDLTGYAMRWVQLFVAGAVLGLGVVLEVRSGVMLIPGEGLPITISKVFNMDFGKVKIVFDVLLVFIATVCCYVGFGEWRWDLIGAGTLFSMFYVGFVVRAILPRTTWIDNALCGKSKPQ